MRFEITLRGQTCAVYVLAYQPETPMRITGWGYGDADPPDDEVMEYQIEDPEYPGEIYDWTLTSHESYLVESEIRRLHATRRGVGRAYHPDF